MGKANAQNNLFTFYFLLSLNNRIAKLQWINKKDFLELSNNIILSKYYKRLFLVVVLVVSVTFNYIYSYPKAFIVSASNSSIFL